MKSPSLSGSSADLAKEPFFSRHGKGRRVVFGRVLRCRALFGGVRRGSRAEPDVSGASGARFNPQRGARGPFTSGGNRHGGYGTPVPSGGCARGGKLVPGAGETSYRAGRVRTGDGTGAPWLSAGQSVCVPFPCRFPPVCAARGACPHGGERRGCCGPVPSPPIVH